MLPIYTSAISMLGNCCLKDVWRIISLFFNRNSEIYYTDPNSVLSQCALWKLRENRKSIPKCLSGKKTFQNCNLPAFTFYPSR